MDRSRKVFRACPSSGWRDAVRGGHEQRAHSSARLRAPSSVVRSTIRPERQRRHPVLPSREAGRLPHCLGGPLRGGGMGAGVAGNRELAPSSRLSGWKRLYPLRADAGCRARGPACPCGERDASRRAWTPRAAGRSGARPTRLDEALAARRPGSRIDRRSVRLCVSRVSPCGGAADTTKG